MTDAQSANGNGQGEARDAWIERLSSLLNDVAGWAKVLGWDTRRIEKRMEDAQAGVYQAPALLLQQEAVRVLLDPIARSAPGAEGVVDLYLLPAYDDIASLYLVDGSWQLHYMFPSQPSVAKIRDAESRPFTKEALADVLDAMRANAV